MKTKYNQIIGFRLEFHIYDGYSVEPVRLIDVWWWYRAYTADPESLTSRKRPFILVSRQMYEEYCEAKGRWELEQSWLSLLNKRYRGEK